MSIIEKAAGRIDKNEALAKAAAAAAAANLSDAHIDAPLEAQMSERIDERVDQQIDERIDARIDEQIDAHIDQPAAAHSEAPADSPAPAPAEPVFVARSAPAAGPFVASPAPASASRPLVRQNANTVDVDLERMHAIGLVTAAGGRTSLVEDFRIIKRPLLKRAFTPRAKGERPGNLIMVTSSLPGEGKTFCSINLAMSIAMELDHTVLLIDADVARPSVLRTLGLPSHRGLMDILLDDTITVPDVMLRTNVDTLTILPAGSSSPRATELLASQAMSTLVNEIANRYPDRIVIFDSPPLLLTSESRVLAGHMGQICLVVEAEGTTQHAVKESLRQLEGCSNVNLIYNKTREFPGTETYDYHYG